MELDVERDDPVRQVEVGPWDAVDHLARGDVVILLGVASGLAVLHTLATTQAAPTMLRIGRAENRAELIAPLLDRFTRLSWIRAALQVLTAAALLWLLVGQGELK
jgi:hypothetical protein